MHIDMTTTQWVLAAIATVCIGMSKTGLTGLGMPAVALYALVFTPRISVGLVLPMLIMGDVLAICTYHAHAQWKYLWRLFPWTGAGLLAGYFALSHIDNKQTQLLIGALLLVMVGLHLWRRAHAQEDVDADSFGNMYWYAAAIGVLAGFATMTANAAGPLMVLFLLLMRLPKLAFVGTGAWFFFIVNLVKVPFSVKLHLITLHGLEINAALAVFILIGAVCGKWMLHRVNDVWFERVTVGLTVLAAVKMLVL